MYEAEIDYDCILSYEWLQNHYLVPIPFMNSLMTFKQGLKWVRGIQWKKDSHPSEMKNFMQSLMKGFVNAITSLDAEMDSLSEDDLIYWTAVSNTPNQNERKAKAYISQMILLPELEKGNTLDDDEVEDVFQGLVQRVPLEEFKFIFSIVETKCEETAMAKQLREKFFKEYDGSVFADTTG